MNWLNDKALMREMRVRGITADLNSMVEAVVREALLTRGTQFYSGFLISMEQEGQMHFHELRLDAKLYDKMSALIDEHLESMKLADVSVPVLPTSAKLNSQEPSEGV